MKQEQNPCFKCTDRKALCHIGCKRAKEFEEKRKAEKIKVDAARKPDIEMRRYMMQKSGRYFNFKEGKYYGGRNY